MLFVDKDVTMTNQQTQLLSEKINQGVQKAVLKTISKHRKLGEAIAVWQDGEVVILPPEKIPKIILAVR